MVSLASSPAHSSIGDASDLVMGLKEELRCDICLKIFIEPKSLACLHSFCKICVERLMKVTANTHDLTRLHRRHFFSCPVCRKRHAIPCNGVDGLQTNFTLANLCEILRKSSDTDVSQKTRCEIHHNKRVNAFCQTCIKCICDICQTGDHQNHDVKEIDEAATEYKQKVTDKIKMCATQAKRIEDHVMEVDEFLNKEADLIAIVKTTKNKCVTALEAQEKDQLQKIKSIFKNRS